LHQDGNLYKKSETGQIEKISPATIPFDTTAVYKLWVINNYYFLRKDSELYVLNPGAQEFKKSLMN